MRTKSKQGDNAMTPKPRKLFDVKSELLIKPSINDHQRIAARLCSEPPGRCIALIEI